MDVIGFLCVSLGSSTVQLRDSLDADAHAHVQRLVSVVKMATVLVYYRRAAFFCAFLWAKGFNAKNIRKEMFSVYGGESLSHKSVHS
jgi:hypothetical protein